ncbi:MAG: hypothetical protein OSA07_06940, partial [Pseudomonadales bacterium]|nr:hypothetical protein [Pseudomonadales bacterium]
MATSNMMIPDLGGAENVEVIEICVAVGDVVSEGDSIIVVETDKASMEIPASNAGTIKNIVLKEGDTCSQGDVMVEVEAADVLGEAAVVSDAVLTPEVEAQAEIKVEVEAVDGGMSNVVVESVVETSERFALVPDLGGALDVEVIEVSVKVGDELAEGDSLVVLETDKASMEIPVAFAGSVLEIKVAEGDKVNVGDAIAVLTSKAETLVEPSEVVLPVAVEPEVLVVPVVQAKQAVAADPAPAQAQAQASVVPDVVAVVANSAAHAGPAVRM